MDANLNRTGFSGDSSHSALDAGGLGRDRRRSKNTPPGQGRCATVPFCNTIH